MQATPVAGSVTIKCVDELPGGVSCLTVDLPGGDEGGWSYASYAALPAALRFGGRTYGKCGWDSDKGIACYSTERANWAVIEG